MISESLFHYLNKSFNANSLCWPFSKLYSEFISNGNKNIQTYLIDEIIYIQRVTLFDFKIVLFVSLCCFGFILSGMSFALTSYLPLKCC